MSDRSETVEKKPTASTAPSPGGERLEAAELLRLAGNDAFVAKDWEGALTLYQDSLKQVEQAKCYSNLAATLVKLSRYDEAAAAAERATTLDPTWAKGWWRRGVVAEKQKLLVEALKYYSIAVELNPSEKTFKKAVSDMEKRLNVTETTAEGMRVVKPPRGTPLTGIPTYIAWFRAREAVGEDVSYWMTFNRYKLLQEEYPTSQQWMSHGASDYVRGMKSAVGDLSKCLSREAHMEFMALQQQRPRFANDEDAFRNAVDQLLGGVPDGHALAHLACGLAHLGGKYFALEVGGVTSNDETPRLCPQPRFLQQYPAYQTLALCHCIDGLLVRVVRSLGRNVVCGKAVLSASMAFYANISVRYPHDIKNREQDPSPEQLVAYVRKQLQNGKTWDEGLRLLCSVNYRGTIMYAQLVKMLGQVAQAYQWEKWARSFITLADAEFQVSAEKTYVEKGTAFRPSFRIGMMMTELLSLNALRGDEINGPYSMEMSLDLCTDIAIMAKDMDVPWEADDSPCREYHHCVIDVATRRKPLALAHSTIASHLITLERAFNVGMLQQIAAHHGLIENEHAERDPFSLIAEHYKIAAENELADDEHAAIYWWGYSANMAQAASNSGYTLGELKRAMAEAEAAEKARDIGLWGENPQRGGTFETVARLTANHYHDEKDSFVLEQVKIVSEKSKTSLCVGDQVICSDFRDFELKDQSFYKQNDEKFPELKPSELERSELEIEHGPNFDGIPSLETLSIRELHKADYEHAKGETDGAVIMARVMMAADKEEKSER